MKAQPIRIRARLRERVTEVQILMPHPMETGLRVDEAGQLVPRHHITEVNVTLGARTVCAARLSFAMSRDPLLVFRFDGAEVGQRLRVTWTDNRGEQRSDEAVIAAA
ncbi:MAG TPA: thiosulfate oxidation carrier complex protein SoxZ [Burkholderiaceae bacterium]